ncbi:MULTISPECIES: DUF3309 family protein [Ralstonia]|nr:MULTISPECIES: DUF3309 family protein [unclassified Ralstonia]HWV04090.1 DUF3309 family protein [Ralstonia sp.]
MTVIATVVRILCGKPEWIVQFGAPSRPNPSGSSIASCRTFRQPELPSSSLSRFFPPRSFKLPVGRTLRTVPDRLYAPKHLPWIKVELRILNESSCGSGLDLALEACWTRVRQDVHGSLPEERVMSVGVLLLTILAIALVGAIPVWPYSAEWTYGPSGAIGVLVLFVLVLMLTGQI